MLSRSRELWLALFAILFITVVYLFVSTLMGAAPAASGLYGHAIGILGFLLMLMTEILYSLRKRSRSARWGKMSSWLEFHIFTGLVGPYMVLLHTSWKFNGVAGVVMLMTVMIVISGFVGRYIYTEVPRTADGIEIESAELQQQIAELEAQLQANAAFGVKAGGEALTAAAEGGSGTTGGLISTSIALVGGTAPLTGKQVKELTKRRNQLRKQISSLASARQMLALWHTVHIPIGLALFSLAFVHVGAAIYYALLR